MPKAKLNKQKMVWLTKSDYKKIILSLLKKRNIDPTENYDYGDPINSILKETMGHLVFIEQVDAILKLIGLSKQEAVPIWIKLAKGKPEAKKEIREIFENLSSANADSYEIKKLLKIAPHIKNHAKLIQLIITETPKCHMKSTVIAHSTIKKNNDRITCPIKRALMGI
jgi:hypothetical protein